MAPRFLFIARCKCHVSPCLDILCNIGKPPTYPLTPFSPLNSLTIQSIKFTYYVSRFLEEATAHINAKFDGLIPHLQSLSWNTLPPPLPHMIITTQIHIIIHQLSLTYSSTCLSYISLTQSLTNTNSEIIKRKLPHHRYFPSPQISTLYMGTPIEKWALDHLPLIFPY